MGGKKGGPARAARLTPGQRSESARRAVQARWAKAKKSSDYKAPARTSMGIEEPGEINEAAPPTAAVDASDRALLALLRRIKATDNPTEIRRLSNQLERVIFHKQFESASEESN